VRVKSEKQALMVMMAMEWKLRMMEAAARRAFVKVMNGQHSRNEYVRRRTSARLSTQLTHSKSLFRFWRARQDSFRTSGNSSLSRVGSLRRDLPVYRYLYS
jgi:hypothetical protein